METDILLRVEKAKLYEFLLSRDIIPDGAGSPSAIMAIEEELKLFILSKLNAVMGAPSSQASHSDQFTPQQVRVLADLADGLIAKKTGDKKPESSPPQVPPQPFKRTPPLAPKLGAPVVQPQANPEMAGFRRTGVPLNAVEHQAPSPPPTVPTPQSGGARFVVEEQATPLKSGLPPRAQVFPPPEQDRRIPMANFSSEWADRIAETSKNRLNNLNSGNFDPLRTDR